VTTKVKSFKYVYDFGDDRQHTVMLEGITEAAPDMLYSRLLTAERACPPEDVGGPWGYANYLEAIADPNHERHAEMIDCRGDAFDPNAVDDAPSALALAKSPLISPSAGHPARQRRGRRKLRSLQRTLTMLLPGAASYYVNSDPNSYQFLRAMPCEEQIHSRAIFDPGSPFADANGLVAAPNVDTAQELVNASVARVSYDANLKVIETARHMQGYLLNIFA
jgi:hypothetical protein